MFSLDPERLPYLEPTLLGLAAARVGDADAARRYAEELEALPLERERRARGGAVLVRALAAAAAGDTAAALELLSSDRRARGMDPIGLAPMLEGELHAAAGSDREALRWFGTYHGDYPFGIVLWAPYHLRMAQTLARLGDHAMAIREYDRFLELWHDPDPPLRPLVEEARRERERLRAN